MRAWNVFVFFLGMAAYAAGARSLAPSYGSYGVAPPGDYTSAGVPSGEYGWGLSPETAPVGTMAPDSQNETFPNV